MGNEEKLDMCFGVIGRGRETRWSRRRWGSRVGIDDVAGKQGGVKGDRGIAGYGQRGGWVEKHGKDSGKGEKSEWV